MSTLIESLGPFWRKLCLRRNVITIFIFFAYFNAYILRVNLSVGIVGMNANYSRVLKNGTIIYVKDVDWNSIERGYVLSAYFYGSVVTPLFAGYLAQKYGGVEVFGIALFFTSLLTYATPYVAMINVYLTIALRILVGIFEGVTFPSMFAILARWSPPKERTRTCSFAYSACPVGTFFALLVGGILNEKFGWPSIFYFTGGLGLIWTMIWLKFAKNQPADDPWISEEEKTYIENSIDVIDSKSKVPWKNIFQSAPVLALACAVFCESWGYSLLYTQLPTFYNDVFRQDVKYSGMLSSLSFIAAPIVLSIAGYIANIIIEKKLLTTTQVRKIFICIPHLGQGLFMVLASYSNDSTVAMLLFTVSVCLGNASYVTIGSNSLDLSPSSAGIIAGIAATVYTAAAFLSPTYAGYMTTNKHIDEWRSVFLTSCGFFTFGSIIFGFFGSGEVQKL